MAKRGKWAKRLEGRLRAAVGRLRQAGREDDGREVEGRFRKWFAARRPGGLVEQRPAGAPARAAGKGAPAAPRRLRSTRRLERRLTAALDAMRLAGRVEDARACLQRWQLWRVQRHDRSGREREALRLEKRILNREEYRRAQQEERQARRRERKQHARRRRQARRVAELCRARPGETRAWRSALRRATAATGRPPEVVARFEPAWPAQRLKWHTDERRGEEEPPPWVASCPDLNLSARGHTRARAVELLSLLIATHEREGPAGLGAAGPRLLAYPQPAEFLRDEFTERLAGQAFRRA